MNLFLSHATRDVTLVDDVRARMQAIGVSVYTAEHDVRAGENVHSKIRTNIEACDVMAVLLTKSGYNSIYVHEEIGYAVGAGKIVIPLATKRAVHSGLGMLEGIEYITIDEDDPSHGLRHLGARVEQLAQLQRQRQRDELVNVALLLATVGIVILAMRESAL